MGDDLKTRQRAAGSLDKLLPWHFAAVLDLTLRWVEDEGLWGIPDSYVDDCWQMLSPEMRDRYTPKQFGTAMRRILAQYKWLDR